MNKEMYATWQDAVANGETEDGFRDWYADLVDRAQDAAKAQAEEKTLKKAGL